MEQWGYTGCACHVIGPIRNVYEYTMSKQLDETAWPYPAGTEPPLFKQAFHQWAKPLILPGGGGGGAAPVKPPRAKAQVDVGRAWQILIATSSSAL